MQIYSVSFLVSVQHPLVSYWLMLPSASAHGTTSRDLSWPLSRNLVPVSASHNKDETFPLTWTTAQSMSTRHE